MRLNVGKAASRLLGKEKKAPGKDELWQAFYREHEVGMNLRRPFEQLWMIHMAYLNSQQYVFFNSTLQQLQSLVRKPGEKRVVDNQLLPKWRRQIADLLKNDPRMSVVPNTQDEEDIQAARIGDKLLQHWWRSAEMRKTMRLAVTWLYSTGNVFLEDRWDRKKGPLEKNEKGELVYAGDVGVTIWTPFDVVVPAMGMFVGDINDLPWIELTKWRTFEWMKDFLPERKGKIETIMPESYSASGVVRPELFSVGAPVKDSELSKGAFFREFRVKPCGKYPKGLQLFCSNGVVIEKNDYPYKEYSITHLKDIEVPGCFWGGVTGEHGIGLQNRWNRTMNSIDEFNETMAKGKWLEPRGANLEASPNNEHGEVLQYTPQMGLKPEHVSVKGLPSTLDEVLAMTRASLENLYSQHEVTRGTNKSDIRSGEMVSLLREQDAHGNIPSHMMMEESLEAFMSRVLVRIQKGYTTPRMIKIPGRDYQWEVMSFLGADLKGNTDVSIERQSSLPDSRAAREARVLERFEKGIYGDPRDPEVRRQVMNMLEDAAVDLSFSDIRQDETVARNETMMLVHNEVDRIIVNPYDNHRVHVKTHNQYRKSYAHQRLKFENPKLFMIFEGRLAEHDQQHQKFIAEEEKRMFEMQMALKGGGKSAQG